MDEVSVSAKEFVETLERTVRADEVLFVCAFAIYQNEARCSNETHGLMKCADSCVGNASRMVLVRLFLNKSGPR